MVGTVRVFCPLPSLSSSTEQRVSTSTPIRETLQSLQLFLVGRCRLDPRWHNVKEFLKLHEGRGPGLVRRLPTESNTFAFWATEPLELLKLHERNQGRWEDVCPKPIHLPGLESPSPSVISLATIQRRVSNLEHHQLAYTFRADLADEDLPHSLSSSSCRYHYAVVIHLRSKAGNNQTRWVQHPFTVLTPDPYTDTLLTSEPIPLKPQLKATSAPCQAMAHSSGLPCAITASDLHQLGGQLTVNRHGSSLYRHVRPPTTAGHLQTLRVADPSGAPVCVLTMIGISPLSPGSRILLKFDFPLGNSAPSESAACVPCHQVSACLQGEESVVRRDGSRVRTRTHLWDTAHEYVDPHCTERTCLHLLLPPDAPCTLETDIMAIAIWCTVDVSVSKAGGTGFQNLRLEIPCRVLHGVAAFERPDDGDDAAQRTPSLGEFMGCEPSSDAKDPSSFYSKDIAEDLRILSLSMADKCGLKPVAPCTMKD